MESKLNADALDDRDADSPNQAGRSEDELISRILEGDKSALEEFLLLNYQALDLYIQRRIPANQRGHVNSEDVIQEVYLRVFRNLKSFRVEGREQLFSWLQTIARNTLFDTFRKIRRDGRVANEIDSSAPNDEGIDHLIEEFAVSTDPRASQCLRTKELASRLLCGDWKSTRRISKRYRNVVLEANGNL